MRTMKERIGFDGSHYYDRDARAGLISSADLRSLHAHHLAQWASEAACGGALQQIHHDLAGEYAEAARTARA